MKILLSILDSKSHTLRFFYFNKLIVDLFIIMLASIAIVLSPSLKSLDVDSLLPLTFGTISMFLFFYQIASIRVLSKYYKDTRPGTFFDDEKNFKLKIF